MVAEKETMYVQSARRTIHCCCCCCCCCCC